MAQPGMFVQLTPIPGLSPADILPDNGMVFQCPPLDEFSQDIAHSHTDYETINNQHSHKGVPQLAQIQFDTLVVDFGTFTVVDDAPPIEEITDTLKEICLSGDPFLLTCAHSLVPLGTANWSLSLVGPEVQFPATLRTLRISERAGEPDARYTNVEFVEYRDPTAAVLRAGGRKFPTTAYLYWNGLGVDAAGKTITSLPTKPLTLALLARFYYGDPAAARAIGNANGLTNWGLNTPLIQNRRFSSMRSGSRIKIDIPKLTASLLAVKGSGSGNVPTDLIAVTEDVTWGLPAGF